MTLHKLDTVLDRIDRLEAEALDGTPAQAISALPAPATAPHDSPDAAPVQANAPPIVIEDLVLREWVCSARRQRALAALLDVSALDEIEMRFGRLGTRTGGAALQATLAMLAAVPASAWSNIPPRLHRYALGGATVTAHAGPQAPATPKPTPTLKPVQAREASPDRSAFWLEVGIDAYRDVTPALMRIPKQAYTEMLQELGVEDVRHIHECDIRAARLVIWRYAVEADNASRKRAAAHHAEHAREVAAQPKVLHYERDVAPAFGRLFRASAHKAMELLRSFGVSRASDIEPHDRGPALLQIEASLAALGGL